MTYYYEQLRVILPLSNASHTHIRNSLEYDRHWWSPKGSGPLRVLGLLLLWLFCSPCIGCHIWHAEGTGYCLLWCCCSLWLDFDAFNDDDDDS